jgi:hypothetical protein
MFIMKKVKNTESLKKKQSVETQISDCKELLFLRTLRLVRTSQAAWMHVASKQVLYRTTNVNCFKYVSSLLEGLFQVSSKAETNLSLDLDWLKS